MPSIKDMRKPNSRLLYIMDKKYGAPAPKVASKTPRKQRQTTSSAMFLATPEHIAAVPQLFIFCQYILLCIPG
jgi:hypothetical protein